MQHQRERAGLPYWFSRLGEGPRRGRGLGLVAAGVVCLMLAGVAPNQAAGPAAPPAPAELPTGGKVVGGEAQISSRQAAMTIEQTSARAAIDWQSFNIGRESHVDIRQPSSESVLLNRIFGDSASQIFGKLTANGQVFLSNPNGIYFAPGASVDVGGLVATTHRPSLQEFLSGQDRFTRQGATGSIVNEGQLRAALGGYIALLAPEVRNHGVIIAELGTVALAAGEAYELRFDPACRLEGIRVDPGSIQGVIDNGQAVLAPGGYIVLSAVGAQRLQGGVIRNSGVLEASSLVSRGGRIVLEGDHIALASGSSLRATGATGGGTVLVGGGWQGGGGLRQAQTVRMALGALIDVSATARGNGGTVVLWSDVHDAASRTEAHGSIRARGGMQGGDGGRIETSGHAVDIDGFTVDTLASQGHAGLWLMDPYDYSIGFSQAGTIRSALATSDVTVTTTANNISYGSNGNNGSSGGISVNSAISGANSLTLEAAGEIFLNANLSATGSGKGIALRAGGSIVGNTANVALSTNGGAVLLAADTDGSNAGSIVLDRTTITTNGGNLWMGSGLAGGTAATGSKDVQGVYIGRSTLNTGAGDITIQGLSHVTSNGSNADGTRNFGVWIDRDSTLQTTSGNITIQGIVRGDYANGVGTLIGTVSGGAGNVTVQTGSGTINVTGEGVDNANVISGATGWRMGMLLRGANANDQVVVKSNSGAINLTGSGNFSHALVGIVGDASGLQFENSFTSNRVQVTSQSGAISLRGSINNEATYAYNHGIRFTATNVANSIRIGYDGTNDYSGNILIETDSLYQARQHNGSGSLSVQTTGGLTIRSAGNSFTKLLASDNRPLTFDDDWNFGTTLGSFMLGKSTNTFDLTLGNALSVAGPITLYGGNLAINAGLTATGTNTITLKGTGNVTDGTNGSVNAANLLLLGGSVMLDSTSNNVATLAASGVGSLTYVGSNAVTLGTIAGTNGISATGAVDIATVTGDLTVAHNVATTSATSTALTLNAGRLAMAGTAAGGNLLVSGSPSITVGAGGRATLYSGSIANSTGMTALIGSGSGRFRYNSDETVSNFTQALGTGTYGVYREQETVTVTADSTLTGTQPELLGGGVNAVTQFSRSGQPVAGSPGTTPSNSALTMPNYAALGGRAIARSAVLELTSMSAVFVRWEPATMDADEAVMVSIPRALLDRRGALAFTLPEPLIRTLGGIPDGFAQPDGTGLPSWLSYTKAAATFRLETGEALSLPLNLLGAFSGRGVRLTIVDETVPLSETITGLGVADR